MWIIESSIKKKKEKRDFNIFDIGQIMRTKTYFGIASLGPLSLLGKRCDKLRNMFSS